MEDLTATDATDVYFEIHILPMLRPADRLGMFGRFDLWKYENLVDPDLKGKILTRLQLPPNDMGLMPPLNAGGPWPAEWIAVLKRWYDTGCKRVEMASANYTARRASNFITLAAQGQVPAANYAVWFDQRPERETPYEFVLYAKPGGNFMSNFAIRLRFPDPGPALTSLTVYDKNGRQSVTIT